MNISALNQQAFSYLHGLAVAYPSFDGLFIFCADAFGVVVLIGLVIFLFSHEHGDSGFHNVIVILSAGALALLAAMAIKYLVGAPRPFVSLNDIYPLIAPPSGSSFPSAHATFFAAIATAIFFYHRALSVIFFLFAIVIGFSRVIVGVHWPQDIVAGLLIGIATGFISYRAYTDLIQTRRGS